MLTPEDRRDLERAMGQGWANVLRNCLGLSDVLVDLLWKADFADRLQARDDAEREGAALISIALQPLHGGRLLRGRDLMGWALLSEKGGEEIGAVMWSRWTRTWTVRCGDWTEEVTPC